MEKDLTQLPIIRTILEMAFPMSWGMLSVIGFNIADTYFIGQLGKVELAAISLTFPVVLVFFSLALGTATGVSSLVARCIGEGNEEKVRRYTSDSLTFALVLVIGCIVFGLASMEHVFRFLGANDQTLPLVLDYMTIWFYGMVFLTIPMAGNGAIRARGDMKVASLIMITAAVTNIILDPIFIFGLGPIPAFGVEGAAIATVIARATTFIASISFLHFKYKMIDFKRPKFSDALKSWKAITHIALPAAGTNLLAPIAMAVATGIIARMGDSHMAAYGVVNRVESLALVFILALSSAVGPFIGQNFGAHKIYRVEKAMYSSYMMALGWGVIMAFFFSLFSDHIIAVFNDDPDVIKQGSFYFTIVPLTFGFLGVRLITGTFFNAIGKPIHATWLGFVNLIIIFIPLVMVGANWHGLKGVFYAHAITNLIVGAIAFRMAKNYLKTKMEFYGEELKK